MERARHVRARLDGHPWTPYLFAAPVGIYLLLFQFYPLVQQLYMSFTATDLLTPDINPFVGVENYAFLIEDGELWKVLWVTAIYTLSLIHI